MELGGSEIELGDSESGDGVGWAVGAVEDIKDCAGDCGYEDEEE